MKVTEHKTVSARDAFWHAWDMAGGGFVGRLTYQGNGNSLPCLTCRQAA